MNCNMLTVAGCGHSRLVVGCDGCIATVQIDQAAAAIRAGEYPSSARHLAALVAVALDVRWTTIVSDFDEFGVPPCDALNACRIVEVRDWATSTAWLWALDWPGRPHEQSEQNLNDIITVPARWWAVGIVRAARQARTGRGRPDERPGT